MIKKQKKKSNSGIITVLMLLIIIAAAVACYYGYNYWIRIEHPIEYSDYVERYALENNIDEYLVYAVIKTESGYDSGAVSNVGARGLMQIMNNTFDWIKFKLGDEDTQYHEMFIPEQNIRYGCYLLGYLYEEFGNIEATMAAYHAGRGSVNEWLSDPRYSSDGVHLDTIPISDTAHYVDKINKAMATYKKLYEN